jgi:photosystem II stability/assembly factor-like uncharacterized protein
MLAFACVFCASCEDYPIARSVPFCEELVFSAPPSSGRPVRESEPTDRRIWFQNSRQGWIVTPEIGLWKTEDGGVSWVRIPIPGQVSDVFFEKWTTAWLLTYRREGDKQRIRLLHTSDGGAHWLARTPFINALDRSDMPLYLLSFRGESGLICSSTSVFHTADHGSSWIQSKLPGSQVVRPARSQFSFVSPTHGWYLDQTRPVTLWETRDSGENWAAAFRGELDFGIHFIDDTRGFGLRTAGVRRPVLYSTERSGADWSEMGYVPVEPEVSGRLQICPGGTLLMSVQDNFSRTGSFWLSGDLGNSWRRVYTSHDYTGAIGFFVNDQAGWVLERADYRESLLGPFSRRFVHTENGGRDWRVLSAFEPESALWTQIPGSPPVRDPEEPCPEQPGITSCARTWRPACGRACRP